LSLVGRELIAEIVESSEVEMLGHPARPSDDALSRNTSLRLLLTPTRVDPPNRIMPG